MKIAITGGAGFLGMHLARYLTQKKHQVTLIDVNNIDPNEYSSKNKLAKIDIRSAKQIDQVISQQQVVIHAAAALPLFSKHDIISTNVQGTKNVLTSSLNHNLKKVVYISSTAVYGVPKKHPILETDPLVGVGTYGETKIEAEKLCRKFIDKGLNITIIRPKTFIGTGRLGVFEILFDWIHDGKRIPIIGAGKNRYQLLDVDDLVYAIYQFSINSNKTYNDVFNIGADQFSTVAKDLQSLFNHAHSGSSLFPTPALPIKAGLRILELAKLSPLYKWVYDTADKDSFVSIDKLKKTLKWTPKYSNSQTLIKSFDWYQDHYKEIKSRVSGTTHTVGWNQGALGFFKKFF